MAFACSYSWLGALNHAPIWIWTEKPKGCSLLLRCLSGLTLRKHMVYA